MSIGNTDPLPQSAPALPGAHSLFTPETFLPRLTEALADLSEPRDIRARTVEILSQARSDAKVDIAAGFMSHPRAARETVRAIASLTDATVIAIHHVATTILHPLPNPTDAERLAVLAIGGYGRAEMAPQSDVDLLFLTPWKVSGWAESRGAILLCGRYEGMDQRFVDRHVDRQISLGDFVVSGGEIAAVTLLDAVARLPPGVLQDEASHIQDSFNPALDGLLDCPHYTRPEVWEGEAVPEVLLGGNHAAIARWRREQSLRLTRQHRPELLEQARAQGLLDAKDEAWLAAPRG